jgi:hypothetical protein
MFTQYNIVFFNVFRCQASLDFLLLALLLVVALLLQPLARRLQLVGQHQTLLVILLEVVDEVLSNRNYLSMCVG